MTKLHTLLLMLIFCSSAFAEQAVLICEIPADEEGEGCGPNNTYETYRFAFDTDEFNKKGGADYGFQWVIGCDVSNAKIFRLRYTVTEEEISFQRREVSYQSNVGRLTSIIVDRESLVAHRGIESYEPERYKVYFPCRLEEGSSEAWSKGRRVGNGWR